MLAAVNDASGAALRSLPRSLTAAARGSLFARKADTEKRQRPTEQINGRDRSAARLALFAANNNVDISTPVLWWDQPWQKERRFLFVLTCMAAAAGPVTSGQGRKPRSGGAERASLEGMAPVRPHGDKQVGTLTARGDTHSRWQRPCAGSANFMRLKSVSAGGRRRPIGGLNVGNSVLLQANASIAPCSRPAWLQRFAHLLARACKSWCRRPRRNG